MTPSSFRPRVEWTDFWLGLLIAVVLSLATFLPVEHVDPVVHFIVGLFAGIYAISTVLDFLLLTLCKDLNYSRYLGGR